MTSASVLLAATCAVVRAPSFCLALGKVFPELFLGRPPFSPIQYATAAAALQNGDNCTHFPTKESHVRPLLRLETDEERAFAIMAVVTSPVLRPCLMSSTKTPKRKQAVRIKFSAHKKPAARPWKKNTQRETLATGNPHNPPLERLFTRPRSEPKLYTRSFGRRNHGSP